MAQHFKRNPFPKEEFDLRWSRARKLMEKKELDAILVTSPSNYRYFVGTGYGWGPRRNAFILPIDKEPAVLVNGAQKHITELQSYIDNINWYDLPFRSERIVDILADLGLARSRIGAEFKHDYMTNISYEVKEMMHDAIFVDATDILQRLRMIKTKNEVEALRDAALRHTTAMLKMMEKIREGMSFRELAWILAECEREEGFTVVSNEILPNVWNVDGKGEWLRANFDPNRKLRKGDYVSFDYGIVGPKGYGADFGTTFVVGEPTSKHLEWWEKCVYITREWMKICKPHIKMSDAHEQACQIVRNAGLDPVEFSGCYAIHRAHFAHGIGIDLVEEPMAASYEHREFEPGMTLCVEPGLEGKEAEGAPKTMHREEEIVITEDGYERLTMMGWELNVVPKRK